MMQAAAETARTPYLVQYYEAIKRGDIIAGHELKTALRQLVQDMNNPRYEYDTREAWLRMDFIEKFVKLTKSPFYGKPLRLMLWQKAFIEALYSFKIKETGRDRFKKAVLLIARKNTKSETSNALAFTELMLGNAGSDIVCASNDDRQANILFEGVGTMRLLFDPKGKRTHKNLQYIKNKSNGTKVWKLSSKVQAQEGFNIDFAIVDEYHEAQTAAMVNAIDQSQSVKENPKRIIISTEGFTNDGGLDHELEYVRGVLAGDIEDETVLPWLYTQDSEAEIWQDETTWVKSNPTLGVVKTYDYLRDRLKRAQFDKTERVFTLCKDFNIKQAMGQAWLLESDYHYTQDVKTFEDFRGCIALAAVDLSETTDLTNLKLLFMRKGDKTKYIFSHYWIPEEKLKKADDKAAGARYAEWAREGYLTICAGSDNNLVEVAEYIAKLKKEYNIRVMVCGYDQRFAKDFLKRCDTYGIKTELINQSRDVLANPMRTVEADLKARAVNYGNNPVDRWCFGNAALDVDNRGRPLCVKIKNNNARRIDGAVTTIILYATLQRYRSDFVKYCKAEKEEEKTGGENGAT